MSISIDPNEEIDKFESCEEGMLVNGDRYQRLIGRLLYLSHAQSNVAFAVNLLSQFMQDP